MPEIILENIPVRFPFQPYPQQEKIMGNIIRSLESSQNSLIESPTGTGKTLCLLCSALAWREHYVKKLEEMENVRHSTHVTADTIASSTSKQRGPQIFYASRTHSQLSQAVKELKRSGYPAKVVVLGSRDQLCVNEQVNSAPSALKQSLCRRKVQTSSCAYHTQAMNYSVQKQVANTIMDIEDLVTYSAAVRACPFYLSKENLPSADVVFLPYNYLIDPVARKAQGVDVTNSIIIFDEAHNLESSCNESCSFEITMTELTQAIQDCDHCVQAMSASRQRGRELKITTEDVLILQQMLSELKSRVMSQDLCRETASITKPGDFIYTLFAKAGLEWENCETYMSSIDGAIEQLSINPNHQSRRSSLSKIQDALNIIFKNLRHRPEYIRYYRVHIQSTKQVVPGVIKGGVSLPQTYEEISLNFWCFSSGVAMQDLIMPGVRSVILASGTLSPLSSFASEMSIPFPHRLENSHVINPSQIFVGILQRGPGGKMLSSSFGSRESVDYNTDLGHTIVNLAKSVPDGMLVFFPSYSLMTKVIAFWRRPSGMGQTIWEKILKHKHVVIEPKDKTEFNQAIAEYESKLGCIAEKDKTSLALTKTCNSISDASRPNLNKNPAPQSRPSGAIFFSVCRGKASEGIDFSDQKGRAVLICGIPYPAAKDAKVLLKKRILDETRGGLNGHEWYRQQAARAVNQAIGRVIRHRQDWGAILLCDARFSEHSMLNQLPQWVRPHVSTYNDFNDAETRLSTFFKNMAEGNLTDIDIPPKAVARKPGPMNTVNWSDLVPGFPEPNHAQSSESKPHSIPLGTLRDSSHHHRSFDSKENIHDTRVKMTIQTGASNSRASSSIRVGMTTTTQNLSSSSAQGVQPIKSDKQIPSNSSTSDSRQLNSESVDKKHKSKSRGNDAKSYLSLLRSSLTAKAFKSFQLCLRDYKSKQITHDELIQRISTIFLSRDVDPSADRIELYAGIRPFLASSRHASFEETLNRFAKKIVDTQMHSK